MNKPKTQFGYAGNVLEIDLSSGRVEKVPTEAFAGRFLGGRGIGVKVCWDNVSPEVKPFDPENHLVFTTGPLAGIPVIGGSRWEVCGRSPLTSPAHFNYCNLGGKWGAFLKFSGWDALIVRGIAQSPVYLVISEHGAELRDARDFWGSGAARTRELLKQEWSRSVSIVAIGPAGENRAVMANLLADGDASGSGGLGAVMGSKNLKAIAIIPSEKRLNIAKPEKLQELIRYYRALKRINLRFPSELAATRQPMAPIEKIKRSDPCYGCIGCYRVLYESRDGKVGKFMCNSAMFYQHWASRYGGNWMDVAFHATRLADTYGVDTKALDRIIFWLNSCYQAGILTDKEAGLPISRIGTIEFLDELASQLALRQGIGDLLASGLEHAARALGPALEEQLRRVSYVGLPGYTHLYSPQLYSPHVIFYAMEPRLAMPQFHEMGTTIPKWAIWARGNPKGLPTESLLMIAREFWGSELSVDFSSCDGKALAAKMIQDREYAKACLILCDNLWPIIELKTSEDHVGDPALESRVVSAVTGRDIDEQELYRIGERVFNLQRAIMVREGHRGTLDDTLSRELFTKPLETDFLNPECLVPGRNGEIMSRKGATVDRDEFERMKSEFYDMRNWDPKTGLQTSSQLESLDLDEVALDLKNRGLVGG